jgi:hypothetical protein
MAHRGENREEIERALADLGWEVRTDDESPDAAIGSYGKHRLMVNFEGGEPTSLIISYVGRGGEILSRKWPGTERLPTPEKVVQVFS